MRSCPLEQSKLSACVIGVRLYVVQNSVKYSCLVADIRGGLLPAVMLTVFVKIRYKSIEFL